MIDLESLKALWEQSPPAKPPDVDHFAWVDDAFREKPDRWPPWCRKASHRRGWQSIYGAHLICGVCHPPVSEAVVKEWRTWRNDTPQGVG